MTDRPADRDQPSQPIPRKRPRRQKQGTANTPPSDPYKAVSLSCGRTRLYDTTNGGMLCIDPGEIALAFCLRRNPDTRGDEGIDTASCLVRIADDAGDVWEAVSTFSLFTFIEKMTDLGSTSGVEFFEEAREWQGAFTSDCLMTGATQLIDDRFYRRFLVGETPIELQFKYQCPTFDVAFYRSPHVSDLTSLLVRVTGFFDLEMNLIPPLVFEMRWWDLLFRNELYFDEQEGWWTGDSWPLPLVFGKTGFQGSPQPLVKYQPGPRSGLDLH